MVPEKAIRRRTDSLRSFALLERYRRVVSGASSKARRHSGANLRRIDHNEVVAREGRFLARECPQSAGCLGRSRDKLGADGPNLQYILPEGSSGAILLRNDWVSPQRTATPNRLHRLCGLAAQTSLEVAVRTGFFPIGQAKAFRIPNHFSIPDSKDAAKLLICGELAMTGVEKRKLAFSHL